MPAMTIFSMAIRYLKDTFLETIMKQMDGFEEDMVHWVLTVPAIWDDVAKQFMREAAKSVSHLVGLHYPYVQIISNRFTQSIPLSPSRQYFVQFVFCFVFVFISLFPF